MSAHLDPPPGACAGNCLHSSAQITPQVRQPVSEELDEMFALILQQSVMCSGRGLIRNCRDVAATNNVLSALIVSKPGYAYSSQVESRFLHPFYLFQWISHQERWLVSSMQDPRTGMPRLWINVLTPQGKVPPMWTFSSLQIPPRAQVLNKCFIFSILPSYFL